MRILGYDRDPISGELVTYGAQDDQLIVKRERDVTAALDYTKALRDAEDYSKAGIKNNLWHCVHIPDTIAAKMLTEDGFDVYLSSARDIRSFLRRNRAKYANLFVTKGDI